MFVVLCERRVRRSLDRDSIDIVFCLNNSILHIITVSYHLRYLQTSTSSAALLKAERRFGLNALATITLLVLLSSQFATPLFIVHDLYSSSIQIQGNQYHRFKCKCRLKFLPPPPLSSTPPSSPPQHTFSTTDTITISGYPIVYILSQSINFFVTNKYLDPKLCRLL